MRAVVKNMIFCSNVHIWLLFLHCIVAAAGSILYGGLKPNCTDKELVNKLNNLSGL